LDVYLALGLLILARRVARFAHFHTRMQFQAMQMTPFVFLPTILLSGFMFPYASVPVPAQWFPEMLPLTHFMRLIRSIMLRRPGRGDLWHECLALIAFIVITLTSPSGRFHRRLD